MAVFKYSAHDIKGKKVSGDVSADNRHEALQKVKEKGLFVLDISRVSERKSVRGGKGKRFLEQFTRQFAGLLKLGYTIDQTLEIIGEHQPVSSFKSCIDEVRKMILKGDSLAQSLSRFRRFFPEYYIQLVNVGESSGTLSEMMEVLSLYQVRRNDLVGHLRNITIYPLLVFITGIGVIGFLLGYVIPVLAGFFEESSVPLPFITKIFLGISMFIYHYGIALCAGLVILAVMVILLLRFTKKTGTIAKWKMSIPFAGVIYRYLFAMQFSYLLSVLLERGISLSKGIEIIRNTINDQYFRKKIDVLNTEVSGGMRFSAAVVDTDVFPKGYASLISVGERGGNLADVFSETAHFYRRELEAKTSFWVKAIEPLIFLVVAGFVAFIVFSILIPLFGISFEK